MKLHRPIRPVRAAPRKPTTAHQTAQAPAPLSMLDILTKRARWLDQQCDRIAIRLEQAEARATLTNPDSVEALRSIFAELLRMHSLVVDAAREACPYEVRKLSARDPISVSKRVSQADLQAEIRNTNDPGIAMKAYLRLLDPGGDA